MNSSMLILLKSVELKFYVHIGLVITFHHCSNRVCWLFLVLSIIAVGMQVQGISMVFLCVCCSLDVYVCVH